MEGAETASDGSCSSVEREFSSVLSSRFAQWD